MRLERLFASGAQPRAPRPPHETATCWRGAANRFCRS